MYINATRCYYIGTEQHLAMGDFLLLASCGNKSLYACVRKVSLHQFGHFMMGKANVGGKRITVSGSYGNDGLPIDWNRLTYRQQKEFVEVPKQVAEIYWKGNGWNDAGNEAETMRNWALG